MVTATERRVAAAGRVARTAAWPIVTPEVVHARAHSVDILTTGVGMVATATWCSGRICARAIRPGPERRRVRQFPAGAAAGQRDPRDDAIGLRISAPKTATRFSACRSCNCLARTSFP